MMYHPTLWASTFMIFDKQDYSVAAYTPYECFTLSQHAVIKATKHIEPLIKPIDKLYAFKPNRYCCIPYTVQFYSMFENINLSIPRCRPIKI